MTKLTKPKRWRVKDIADSSILFDRDKYKNFPFDVVANFYENKSLARKVAHLLNKEKNK